MTVIHLFALFTIALFLGSDRMLRRRKLNFSENVLWYLMVGSLAVRVLFAYNQKGFDTDTACFSAWSVRVLETGFGGFYSPDSFSDYPPGFVAVLGVVGLIYQFLKIPYYSGAHLLLLKLPAILCDLAIGALLYKEASRRAGESKAVLLSALYLLNPAVILNSSVWGQVDSCFTLTLILMCLYLMRGRTIPAYAAFGIGVLLKPQMLVFTPVLLVGIWDHVFVDNFSPEKFRRNLFGGLAVIAGMAVFASLFGLDNVLHQYANTLGEYPYAAVNAYNFWGLWGLNWVPQETLFLGIPCKTWGSAAIVFILAATVLLAARRKKDASKYPMLGAFIILTMFVFSVRMHERYMFPALALLLLACICRPSHRTLLICGAFSVLHFYNTANVLFFYDPQNYDRKASVILLVSAGMLFSLAVLYRILWNLYIRDQDADVSWKTVPTPAGAAGWKPVLSEKRIPLNRKDCLWMLVVTVVYACIALYDLGERTAPETEYTVLCGEEIVLDFGGLHPTKVSYFIAPWHNRTFTAISSNSPAFPAESSVIAPLTLDTVFTWKEAFLPGDGSYLRLALDDDAAHILELCFRDAEGNRILPANASSYPALFDEQELVPERSTFRTGMYFDEIYHARTAYEMLHGMYSYENTHPPLGKVLISFGVALFGMTPFGWRITGTFLGILMVPLLYLFARSLTGKTSLAAFGSVLFAFDFMHFTQSRLATIDVYITFFVILMYYFMYQYSRQSFFDTPLKKTWPVLGACGVCMGLGVASKWTGVYAGIGLGVIFFLILLRRYQEYRYAKNPGKKDITPALRSRIQECFLPDTKKTILFCIVFFVCVPVLIYTLSYIPFSDGSERSFLGQILHNQETMYNYHSTLDATHPYSSRWYEWPTISRPIWYYSGNPGPSAAGEEMREGISAFGNPLVWWAGIPAFFFTAYRAIKKRDRKAAFLTIGYLAQYMPWFFITRCTFIYHYFPSVVFVVLMITYCMDCLDNALSGAGSAGAAGKKPASKKLMPVLLIAYGAAVVALFALFYPVLSGQPVRLDFVLEHLRWLEGWVLVG